jgi:hypothetical protein
VRGQLRIEQMYAFVVVDDDGTEGIPAFRGPGGLAMPMVGADLERVESLRPMAKAMAKELGKPLELLVFTGRESVEVIEA